MAPKAAYLIVDCREYLGFLFWQVSTEWDVLFLLISEGDCFYYYNQTSKALFRPERLLERRLLIAHLTLTELGVCPMCVVESPKIWVALLVSTMRTNLLNWCNLVSISKNVVFFAFLVVRIY